MAQFKKPNHICKNSNCGKLYYACDYCDRVGSWRSMCCSKECYEEYMKQIIEARGKNILPERTDKTEEEMHELMNTPVEQVAENTKEELREYMEEYNTDDVMEVVDIINSENESNSESVEAEDTSVKSSNKRKRK